jgi:hypothetical protein
MLSEVVVFTFIKMLQYVLQFPVNEIFLLIKVTCLGIKFGLGPVSF